MVRFGTAGAVMWLASIAGTIVGGLVVPALGVYRPELFPTSLRGRAAGFLELIALAGSSLGLIAVGYLSDRWDDFAWPMAIMAIAPLVVVGLVLTMLSRDRPPLARGTEPRGPFDKSNFRIVA